MTTDIAPPTAPSISVVRIAASGRSKVHYVPLSRLNKPREIGERLILSCAQRIDEGTITLRPIDCSFCANVVGQLNATNDVTEDVVSGCIA